MKAHVLRAVSCAALGLLVSTFCLAGGPSLVRIERGPGIDRNILLESGLPLVAEMTDCFLALGEVTEVTAAAARHSLQVEVLDADADQTSYAIAGLRPGWTAEELARCGQALWFEENWVLLEAASFDHEACFASPSWFLQELSRTLLRPLQPPPERFAHLAGGEAPTLELDPLVQQMVNDMTDSWSLATWTAIISSSTSRYTHSSLINNAINYVKSSFNAYGLDTELHTYSGSYPPNVVGTLPGLINPDDVYIVIGHLDDLPSSGSAPGADDNASGSAMVLALADIMSDYRFANTVKFLAVTGEEQGLVGSSGYADDAYAAGENILAVLNGDMIGWEGDGSPATENLDLNYNDNSIWLGTLFAQAATDYSTGLVVDAFSCPSLGASDHAPFWAKGWSAVCGITDNEGYCGHGGHYPYYHQSSDTIANCGDTTFFSAGVRAYLATLAHMAQPLCKRPNAPLGAGAVGSGDNQITVSWLSLGTGITYEVYRTSGGCAGLTYTKIGETPDLSFVDTTASGGLTYGYRVSAVDPSGYCTGPRSVCVAASTTGECLEPPQFAGVTAVTDQHSESCSLAIEWDASPQVYCGSTARYNLYRSTTSGFEPGPGNLIASCLSETCYVDTSVDPAAISYYVVRAEDDTTGHGGPCGGNEDSNTVELSGTPSGPITIVTSSDDAGDTDTAKLTTNSPWHIGAIGGNNGPMVYLTEGYGNNTCAGLITPSLRLTASSELSFSTKYDIESGWDKGEVQISTDGGTTWTRVPLSYPQSSSRASDACGLPSGTTYFTGTNLTYGAYTTSLAAWADQEVLLRWVISSDSGTAGTGWWIDDITVTNIGVAGPCDANGIFSDGFESGDTSAWSETVVE
jgi:hypothetical protein